MKCGKTVTRMSPKTVMLCCKKFCMQVAAQNLEYDIDQNESMQANNKYVEPIDPHSDEIEDDDWVNATRVEHIT